MRNNGYPLTRKALAAYDQHAARMGAIWESVETTEDVEFAQHLDLMRGDYVRQAYLQDTLAVNSWSGVRCMSIRDMRMIVAR